MCVTVNVFESELHPSVALTICGPLDDAGTVKVAENTPLLLVVTGDSGRESPLKDMTTVELGANPAPEISTGVPTGPVLGLRNIVGPTKGVTVNVFEAELDPRVASTL